MQKIVPFLWFDNDLEEAVHFYTSVFKNSRIVFESRLEGTPGPQSSVMTATFELEGLQFMALNGGPQFAFTPAISLYVNCETQAEIDYLWERLTEGGQEEMCGWLRDKFGVSWQIIPTVLSELLYGPDGEKSQRAMQAMLQMKKLDIARLKQAYEGT